MPVLKPAPFVTFDETNPDHVEAMMAILNSSADPDKAFTRNVKINFDYPHPFASAVAYATHCMAKAWGRQILNIREEPQSSVQPQTKVNIGCRTTRSLQDVATRSLPHGTKVH